MSNLQVIYTPFTGVGLRGGYRGDEWLKERIAIFKQYTLASLVNQMNRSFIHWISFRPEEMENPQVKELGEYMEKLGYSFVMTFDGLMYYDDKFSPRHFLGNLGRIIRDFSRGNSKILDFWEILSLKKNGTLEARLEHSLGEVKKAILPWFDKIEWVYLTRIDSDDMFVKDVTAEIQYMKPFSGALVYKEGYVYNDQTKELADWNPKTNPPFHTIMMTKGCFFNAPQHIEHYRGYKSHEDIAKKFPHIELSPRKYCVLVHNPSNHISTVWNHPFRGKVIMDKKEEILKSFGING